MVLGEPLKRIQKYAKYGWIWAQAKKTSIDYLLPLSKSDQTSEERTFEEDIKMRADEGFEDEERGQLRKSRVEVAENYEERIDNAKGKLATLLETMNNMFEERIPVKQTEPER